MKTTTGIVSIACAALLLAPRVASAQAADPPATPGPAFAEPEASPDEVVLQSGASLRGTIAGVEPGVRVLLVLPNGEQRAILWVAVRLVKHNGAVVAEAPPREEPRPIAARAPAYPVALPAPDIPHVASLDAKPSPGRPLLHIDTEQPQVGLYVQTGQTIVSGYRYAALITEGRLVCEAPCDRVIEGASSQLFYFGGPELTQSSRFTLSGDRDITARVSAGSNGVRRGGAFLTGAALAGALLGGALALGGAAAKNHDRTRSKLEADSALETAGGITAGVSGGFVLLGVILIGAGQTSYSLDRREAHGGTLRFAGVF